MFSPRATKTTNSRTVCDKPRASHSLTMHPTPADVTRVRVAHRVRREFLTERNVIDDRTPTTRDDIRDAVLRLTPAERKELKRRTIQARRDLTDLMDGSRKTFDEPRATEDDLATEDVWAWRNQ